MDMTNYRIGIIGLGYVGFPLACLFSRKFEVVGFDVNENRVRELCAGTDSTGEIDKVKVQEALQRGLLCTSDKSLLKDCNVYIVTVPTPVDKHNTPDGAFLERASRLVGELIDKGDIVIFESTVYPGMTEEFCAPIIEEVSGMTLNTDFYLGYSPERINPGDKLHTVEKIKKITSGSTPEVAEVIDRLYNAVLENGTHLASSIRVAEAAKILENSQRDVNIAFMNEAAMIFNAMGIDTGEVLKAASTKWNFLPFKPGLVGGHCISVDPYYLIQKAKFHGIIPRLLSEARMINDAMGGYIAERILRMAALKGVQMKNASVLILGVTFKENCPDIRNSKVIDIYKELKEFTDNIDVYDTWANPMETKEKLGISILTRTGELEGRHYDIIVQCVNHDSFKKIQLKDLCNDKCVVYDVKGVIDRSIADERL